LNAELRSLAAERSGRAVVVRVETHLPAVNAGWTTAYTIHGSGEIAVQAEFTPQNTALPVLPRLGMEMILPAGFDRIAWFGPGPQETYIDRKDARVGLYQGTVREQFFYDYSEPGESGNKVDVRWVALTNQRGAGLLAIADPSQLLSVNAIHHTADELISAEHPFQLPPRESVVLNLDLRQQGVGGDDSWGAWPHEQYRIPCTAHKYSFRLRPLPPGADPKDYL
jgi:beta-galactosidase